MKLTTALLGSALFLSSFTSSFAEEVKGSANVTFTKLYAVDVAAAPRYEQFDAVCKNMFGSLLNTTASIDYMIDTTTGYQDVWFNYAGAHVQMSAMGLSSSYGFIGSGKDVPALNALDIRNFFFKMDRAFKNESSSFTFNFTSEVPNSGIKFHCILEG